MNSSALQVQHAPAPVSGGAYGRQSTVVGAALGIVGVALIAAGFGIAGTAGATINSTAEEVVAHYTVADQVQVLAGGLLGCLGLLLILVFAVMLTGRLRGPGTAGELFPAAARVAFTAYAGIGVAPGLAAAGTALWLAQRGTADAEVLLALNLLGVVSHLASLIFFAAFFLFVGASAVSSRALPAWVAWSAVVIGVAQAVTVPVAASELPDMVSLLGLAWIVVVGVTLVRRPAAGAIAA